MHQVDPAFAEAFAPHLTVTHQETGAIEPLRLSFGQRKVLRAIASHRRVVVLKGRQVYISTLCCLYALLFAACNPGVKVALVADVQDKAEGLLAKVIAWAREAGFPTTSANTKRLVLWNGAEVHAITANTSDTGSKEVKAGRSFSYGLIVLSEFAYYTRDAALLASLTRSALAGAHIVIETTATPAENAFRSIWEKGRGWHKVFLPFEEHEAYQLPVDATDDEGKPILDDETWAELQAKYEFTSRTHATYWWRMVQTDFNGDLHRGLRESPIKQHHAFSYAEGRWIFKHEAVEPRREELKPTHGDARVWTFADEVLGGWRFYDEPDASGVIFGVDTGSGVGKDASAIAIVGREKGNLIATFVARNLIVPHFQALTVGAVEKWQPFGSNVEGNGIGKAIYQALSLVRGARVDDHNTSDAEKPIRMQLVKQAIESGQIAAGPELQYEVKHSEQKRPKKPNGAPVWDGPDDLLNALGFALVFRRDNPYRSPAPRINPRTHVDRESYRKKKRKVVV